VLQASLCVGDLVRMGLSSVSVAGFIVCWRFGTAGVE